MVTDPQTHTNCRRPLQTRTQTGPITIHCVAKLSAQCSDSAAGIAGIDFYRVSMPMHVDHDISMTSLTVCPSVCLSHAGIVSKQMQILKTHSTTWWRQLVFLRPTIVTKFQGGPPLAGVLNTRLGKIRDFRPKSPFISETVRDRPMGTMDH